VFLVFLFVSLSSCLFLLCLDKCLTDNIDKMQIQFQGNEEELISTLQALERQSISHEVKEEENDKPTIDGSQIVSEESSKSSTLEASQSISLDDCSSTSLKSTQIG